jgi:hypothetical protein
MLLGFAFEYLARTHGGIRVDLLTARKAPHNLLVVLFWEECDGSVTIAMVLDCGVF